MIRAIRSLVNSGVTSESTFEDIARLRGMNTGICTGLTLLAAAILLGVDSVPFILHMLALAVTLSLSLIFNRLGHTGLARYLAIFSIAIWIIVTSINFGNKLNLEDYFYVLLTAVLLFEKNNIWRFSIALAILGLLLGLHIYLAYYQPVFAPPRNVAFFHLLDIIMPGIIIAILTWRMHREVGKYRDGILKNREQLRSSNQLKDQMLSIIGHDLRTPINNLKSVLPLMETTQLTVEEQQMILQELQHRLDVSEQLVNGLLEWSFQSFSSSSSAPGMEKTSMSLHNVCHQVFTAFQNTADEKSIALINKIPGDTITFADPGKLLFVFRNLVGNALKFGRDDGKGFVTVSAEIKDNWLSVSIADNGVGIEESRIASLFDISVKHSTAGTRNEKGAGLGLIFCKEFVEHNGGNLFVESRQGAGSTFAFTLPLYDGKQQSN